MVFGSLKCEVSGSARHLVAAEAAHDPTGVVRLRRQADSPHLIRVGRTLLDLQRRFEELVEGPLRRRRLHLGAIEDRQVDVEAAGCPVIGNRVLHAVVTKRVDLGLVEIVRPAFRRRRRDVVIERHQHAKLGIRLGARIMHPAHVELRATGNRGLQLRPVLLPRDAVVDLDLHVRVVVGEERVDVLLPLPHLGFGFPAHGAEVPGLVGLRRQGRLGERARNEKSRAGRGTRL